MELESLIAIVVVGLIAGALARVFIKNGSMGTIGDLLVGISGALIIGFMLPTIGISFGGGLYGAIGLAIVGAILAIYLMRKAKTP